MIGHQMTPAFPAIFALAGRRLREGRDMFLAGGYSYRLRLPQRECVHGPARPRSARTAVTIAHGFRCAADLDLHGATEAVTDMIHGSFSLLGFHQDLRHGIIIETRC